MLAPLLGNNTVEKILFYLMRYEQGYPKGMADNFKLPVNAIQQQLKRLENGGIVVSRLIGKIRLYQMNPSYPFLKELNQLLKKAFDFLPVQEIEDYYMQRTRPRRPGKPI